MNAPKEKEKKQFEDFGELENVVKDFNTVAKQQVVGHGSFKTKKNKQTKQNI